ncbi:MAG: 4-alpha-glucanotransferase, partial [Gemmatimonadaceae bacterium]
MTRAPLRALADHVGILSEYVDQTGKERRRTTDATRVALLAAMGIDAGDAAAARRALEELTEREASRVVPPVRVVARRGRDAAEVALALPAALGASAEWALELREEGGATHRAEGRARRPREGGALRLRLPVHPPLGYHELRVALRGRGEERATEQTLVVVPPACPSPARLLRGERVAGLTANLYAVRSARNWGVGDLTDLGELLAYAHGAGAAFVGVNPLHALRNRGGDISPYSPVSRLFRNVLYLDVERVPELAHAPEARERIASAGFRRELARLRESRQVDYESVMAIKLPLLETLHSRFRGAPRREEYDRYLAAQGRALEDFATFCALEEHFTSRAPRAASWRAWPAPYRDPASPAVDAFRREHAERVDFHRWLQFALDRQLAAASARGRALGLPVGVYQDLAIGSAGDGSDCWAYQSLFVTGASIGAPPDPYAALGQNWGLPPVDPRRLAERRYDYWIALVRSALRHAGALRIDHVMGLFRQFWIPEG